jgi:hypothetical protein
MNQNTTNNNQNKRRNRNNRNKCIVNTFNTMILRKKETKSFHALPNSKFERNGHSQIKYTIIDGSVDKKKLHIYENARDGAFLKLTKKLQYSINTNGNFKRCLLDQLKTDRI